MRGFVLVSLESPAIFFKLIRRVKLMDGETTRIGCAEAI
jgi:hypothetical protein